MELKDIILSKFKSQSEMASKLGWSRQRLNRYVNGEVIPTLADTQAIAKILNQPVEKITDIFLTQSSRK